MICYLIVNETIGFDVAHLMHAAFEACENGEFFKPSGCGSPARVAQAGR